MSTARDIIHQFREIQALELFTSALCPLNCRYCYIPKCSAMANIHNDIIQNTLTNEQTRIVKEKFPNLRTISLWGAEPTVSLENLLPKLKKFAESINKLDSITFSTNFVNIKPIKHLLKVFEDIDIELKIQISLDGPDFITDYNRAPGLTKRILENIDELIDFAKQLEFKRKPLIHFKSTITTENMRYMLNRNLIEEYFSFWDELFSSIKEKESNMAFILKCYPTLEVPGRYTKLDGETFANFLKQVHSIGQHSDYTFRLIRLVQFSKNLYARHHEFTCSAMDSNLGLDGLTVHPCHRTFFLDRQEYLDAILRMDAYQNWDVSLLDKGLIDAANKNFVVPIKDNDFSRFAYLGRAYHDFFRFRVSITSAIIHEMALAGEVGKYYLRLPELRELLSIFLHAAVGCPVESILNSGSIHLPILSLIRLFGNGAFIEVIKDAVNTLG